MIFGVFQLMGRSSALRYEVVLEDYRTHPRCQVAAPLLAAGSPRRQSRTACGPDRERDACINARALHRRPFVAEGIKKMAGTREQAAGASRRGASRRGVSRRG